jgi:catechol 2,3-dioxygenase-like lactoylglutathione lyase family enzyme
MKLEASQALHRRARAFVGAFERGQSAPETFDALACDIARFQDHVVLDCPDPPALATFYSSLLGLPVTYRDDTFVVVAVNETTSGLAFQRAPSNRAPTWPDPAVPQQIHLDVMVEDPAAAGPQVLALGEVKLDGEDVYADPAGHPFCLVRRPRWALPIPATPDGSRDPASN